MEGSIVEGAASRQFWPKKFSGLFKKTTLSTYFDY